MNKHHFLGLSPEGFHKVVYQEWGSISPRPPIICVHGLTRLSHDFDALATYLSVRGHKLYCPDIVGRGDSDWLADPAHYSYEQYLADMNVMIAKTDSDAIDWIGTSMGGIIGMMLAAEPHSPIRRLVLNDVGPQIAAKSLARLFEYAGHDPDFTSLEAAKAYYKTIYSGFGSLTEAQWDNLVSTSVREIRPGVFASKLDHHVTLTSPKSHLAWKAILHPQKIFEGSFLDIDLWDIFRKITCPILVIHGQQSDILTKATLAKMQEIHPQTTIYTVADAGHAPALLETAQHEVIQQFLA